MIVKYSKIRPFWIYGNDKIISKDKLEEWLNNNGFSYNNEFKINEYSLYEVSIITRDPNIEYFKYTNNYDYFYYKTDISFLANGFYKINFSIDWYATYFLNIANEFYTKEMFIKRAHETPLPSTFYKLEDEKLQEISPNLGQRKYVSIKKYLYVINGVNFWSTSRRQVTYCYQFSANKWFTSIVAIFKNWINPSKTNFIVVPLTNQGNESALITQALVGAPNGSMTMESRVNFNNGMNNIRELLSRSEWSNAFVGFMTYPNIDNIINGGNTVHVINDLKILWCYSYELTQNITMNTYFNALPLNISPYILNVNNKIYHPQIINFTKPKITNQDLTFNDMEILNDFIYLKNGFTILNNDSFTFFTDNDYQDIANIGKRLAGPLASKSNNYLNYVEQNKYRSSTQMLTNVINGVGASILFGRGSVISGVGSLVKSYLDIDAQYETAKKTNLPSINTSYDQDNAWWEIDRKYNGNANECITYYDLLNIKKYNNQIVYYGYKIEEYKIPSIEFNATKTHYYLQIDANDFYLRNKELFNKIPFTFLENILQMLNEGVRFWESEIRYNYA